ncbi:MAG: G8 domain-containing protein, partial [Cyanobacteria bacterium P01_G01_bin.38]
MMNHQMHPDDPTKMKEHEGLLDLVPTNKATHVAVKNGSWFDPATWQGGRIPGDDANVLIEKGTTVKYDGVSEAELFTLRVDGEIQFAPDKNTKMVIDTFVVSPDGKLQIGTKNNPVKGNVKTEIEIAGNGSIDLKWDPQQLSRGIISIGEVEIYGQQKTSHLKVAVDPMAGQNTLVLEKTPQNWQVGDTIVLTGTRVLPRGKDKAYLGTEDEEFTIEAISGNRITLDKPLEYDHTTPRGDLKAYVANYSRNVVVSTRDAESLPANQRGHVMLMHSNKIDVRYAEFDELGRTDKSKRLDDFLTKDDRFPERVLDANGNPISGKRTNIRGRYALHLHQSGTDVDSSPAILEGNAVWGSPGWGIAQHDSYAILENNATYKVNGVGFMSETGNETGAWRNNIAINTTGRSGHPKEGTKNHDLGFNGNGFWLQSRVLENENNVAAGSQSAAFMYFHRGVDNIKVDADNLPIADLAKGKDEIGVEDSPIMGFRNNEAFASGAGLWIIKNFPQQQHDARTVLDGFKGWEVEQGSKMEYTAHYTVKDFDLIAAKDGSRFWVSNGINLGNNVQDMVFDNFEATGFEQGVFLEKSIPGKAPLKDWGYVFVDPKVSGNKKDFVNFDKATDRIVSKNSLKSGDLKFELSPSSDLRARKGDKGDYAVVEGTKIDSLGEISYPFGSESLTYRFEDIKGLVAKGYYTLPNGQRAIVANEYFSDRVTGEMLKYPVVITLEDSFWTNNKPSLGPLNPNSDLLKTKRVGKISDYTLSSRPKPSVPEPEPPSNPAPEP